MHANIRHTHVCPECGYALRTVLLIPGTTVTTLSCSVCGNRWKMTAAHNPDAPWTPDVRLTRLDRRHNAALRRLAIV